MLSFAVAALLSAPNPNTGRVVVVMNSSSRVSMEVGSDYMRRRGVPEKLIVNCQDSAESAASETIPYLKFHDSIESPLKSYLSKHPKIDFILLTKGIPIRIIGSPGLGISGTQLSLDSYLAALDYSSGKDSVKVTLTDTGFNGTAWANRFWNSNERFSHAKFGGYL